MQDDNRPVTDALARGDLEGANLSEKERRLFEFVAKVTRHAYKVVDDDTEELRAAGWEDPQIAEAVYITALFAFFNRVADAFGLEDPGYLRALDSGEIAGLPPKEQSIPETGTGTRTASE